MHQLGSRSPPPSPPQTQDILDVQYDASSLPTSSAAKDSGGSSGSINVQAGARGGGAASADPPTAAPAGFLPAYYIAVDHDHRAIRVVVRGTSVWSDLMTDGALGWQGGRRPGQVVVGGWVAGVDD